jgi:hypothetical protein
MGENEGKITENDFDRFQIDPLIPGQASRWLQIFLKEHEMAPSDLK